MEEHPVEGVHVLHRLAGAHHHLVARVGVGDVVRALELAARVPRAVFRVVVGDPLRGDVGEEVLGLRGLGETGVRRRRDPCR